MITKKFETIDGNEAAARVAYQLNEVIALFPITPVSPMANRQMERPRKRGAKEAK
jgi:pyruvate-ferredoxin/flavodoxin oxidoreductase